MPDGSPTFVAGPDPRFTPLDPAVAELLARYWAGEATDEEAKQAESWLARPELEARARLLREAWDAVGRGASQGVSVDASLSQGFVERVLHEVAQRSQGRVEYRGSVRKNASRLGTWPLRPGARIGWRIPATVALVASGMVLALAKYQSRVASISLSARTYTTAPGQQAPVILSDGSRVYLGPATTLSVTTQASDDGMDVHVDGEALFTVVHRPDRPFRVHIHNAVLRVLGTTFMMRRYATDRVTRIVVTDGRVSLSSALQVSRSTTTAPVLVANTMGVVDDSGHVEVTPNIVADEYTGWSRGELVFRDTPVREALAELSRSYSVELRVVDSALATKTLNWTVPVAQQSLSDVLELLVELLDAHPVRAGHSITFVPGRAVSRRPTRPLTPISSERQYGR